MANAITPTAARVVAAAHRTAANAVDRRARRAAPAMVVRQRERKK